MASKQTKPDRAERAPRPPLLPTGGLVSKSGFSGDSEGYVAPRTTLTDSQWETIRPTIVPYLEDPAQEKTVYSKIELAISDHARDRVADANASLEPNRGVIGTELTEVSTQAEALHAVLRNLSAETKGRLFDATDRWAADSNYSFRSSSEEIVDAITTIAVWPDVVAVAKHALDRLHREDRGGRPADHAGRNLAVYLESIWEEFTDLQARTLSEERGGPSPFDVFLAAVVEAAEAKSTTASLIRHLQKRRRARLDADET